MTRPSKAATLALCAGLLLAACSSKESKEADRRETTGTTQEQASATTEAPAKTTTTVDTDNDEELARSALITVSDLPPGEWTTGSTDSSAGNDSDGAGRLRKVPSCKKLVEDPKAIEASSTGRASVEFSRGADSQIQISNDVELWPSAETVKQIGTLTDAPGFQECMSDAISSQMADNAESPFAPSGFRVSGFNVGVDAESAGVDFITGVTIKFNLSIEEMTGSGTVRMVFIGSGRGLATVSLMGFEMPSLSEPVNLDSIDLAKPVKAAAAKLAKIT
jgi:hypothetical protein